MRLNDRFFRTVGAIGLLVPVTLGSTSQALAAGLTTKSGLSASDIANTLVGNGVTITNVTYAGTSVSGGTFAGGSGIIGFEEGIVLSSGNISGVVGPNTSDGTSTSLGIPGDSDLNAIAKTTTYDATKLEFDFVPNADEISFQYVFASEEYNEYVNSFNDAFGLFINGKNCASLPDGTPVTINNVNLNKNTQYYRNNDISDGGGNINTGMDGLTVVLTCTAPVNKGATNHVKLAVADAADASFDSVVFIKADSFSTAASQTITFDPIGSKTYGDADFTVSATASSGLPVSFSTTGSCTIINGITVHLTGAGSCVVTASQAGDATYSAAPDVSQTISIAKATQTITFDALSDQAYGSDFAVSASASSGLPVSFAANGDCTIENGLVHLVSVGSCTITASQDGNTDYEPAKDVMRSFKITQASQTISFAALGDKTYGDADFALNATASSGLDVSFAASGQCIILNGSTVHLLGVGSCAITASQEGNTNFSAAESVVRSFQIAKADQIIAFDELEGQTIGNDLTIGATASSDLPVSFSVSGDCTLDGETVRFTGSGTCTITATQAGNEFYNAATPVVRTVSISKKNQTIDFALIGTKTYGSGTFEVSATASSGLAVSFNAAGTCTISGSTVTLDGAGECTITAQQAGDASYNPAEDVAQTFTIAKASQTITFGAPDDKTYGDADFTIKASSTSGLEVSFSATGPCTVDGTLVHLTGAGTCTITASQQGDGNYQAASDVTRSFAIAKTAQTISVDAPATKTYGDADFAIKASSTSGLAVTLAGSGACSVSADVVHILGAGDCTITATQDGNNNIAAAQTVTTTIVIAKANQTITFDELQPQTAGSDITIGAKASSGLPVTFSVSGQCTLINSNTVRLTGGGTCTITASQAGDSNYNPAEAFARSFSINKKNQTITFGSLKNRTYGEASFTVSATASSGLAASFKAAGDCTISSKTVKLTGAGSCTVTAQQAGNAVYNPAEDVAQTFTIAKANQAITFGALSDKTFGDPDFTISASASSGLAVSFVASGSCTVNGTLVHLTGAGVCTITARQLGDGNYNAAESTARAFAVGKLDQTLVIGTLSEKRYGDPDFTVNASATSGLAVTISDGAAADACTVSGSNVHITGAGSCTIRVSQAGNASYTPATTSVTIAIGKAAQSITFGPTERLSESTFRVSATASSGLAVSLNVSGECSISGDTVEVTGSGACTVTATQAGNELYSAATPATTELMRAAYTYLPIMVR